MEANTRTWRAEDVRHQSRTSSHSNMHAAGANARGAQGEAAEQLLTYSMYWSQIHRERDDASYACVSHSTFGVTRNAKTKMSSACDAVRTYVTAPHTQCVESPKDNLADSREHTSAHSPSPRPCSTSELQNVPKEQRCDMFCECSASLQNISPSLQQFSTNARSSVGAPAHFADRSADSSEANSVPPHEMCAVGEAKVERALMFTSVEMIDIDSDYSAEETAVHHGARSKAFVSETPVACTRDNVARIDDGMFCVTIELSSEDGSDNEDVGKAASIDSDTIVSTPTQSLLDVSNDSHRTQQDDCPSPTADDLPEVASVEARLRCLGLGCYAHLLTQKEASDDEIRSYLIWYHRRNERSSLSGADNFLKRAIESLQTHAKPTRSEPLHHVRSSTSMLTAKNTGHPAKNIFSVTDEQSTRKTMRTSLHELAKFTGMMPEELPYAHSVTHVVTQSGSDQEVLSSLDTKQAIEAQTPQSTISCNMHKATRERQAHIYVETPAAPLLRRRERISYTNICASGYISENKEHISHSTPQAHGSLTPYSQPERFIKWIADEVNCYEDFDRNSFRLQKDQ